MDSNYMYVSYTEKLRYQYEAEKYPTSGYSYKICEKKCESNA